MDLATRAALFAYARHALGGTADDAWAAVDRAVDLAGDPVDEAGLRRVFSIIDDQAARSFGLSV